jgi:hypothetical protein
MALFGYSVAQENDDAASGDYGQSSRALLQRFANSFVKVAHACNLKARAVNPEETDWFSHYPLR